MNPWKFNCFMHKNLSTKLAKTFQSSWKSMHVYQNGMDNVCLKHTFFIFLCTWVLLTCQNQQWSQSTLVSSWDMDMSPSCAPWLLPGILHSPPSSSENDRNRRIEAVQEGVNFPILFTHANCYTDSILADLSFLLDKRTDTLLHNPWQKDCFPLCEQLKFKHVVVLLLNSPKLQTSSEWKQLTGPLYLGIN